MRDGMCLVRRVRTCRLQSHRLSVRRGGFAGGAAASAPDETREMDIPWGRGRLARVGWHDHQMDGVFFALAFPSKPTATHMWENAQKGCQSSLFPFGRLLAAGLAAESSDATSARIWVRKAAAAGVSDEEAAAAGAGSDPSPEGAAGAVPAFFAFRMDFCKSSTRLFIAFFLRSATRQSRRALRAIAHDRVAGAALALCLSGDAS